MTPRGGEGIGGEESQKEERETWFEDKNLLLPSQENCLQESSLDSPSSLPPSFPPAFPPYLPLWVFVFLGPVLEV